MAHFSFPIYTVASLFAVRNFNNSIETRTAANLPGEARAIEPAMIDNVYSMWNATRERECCALRWQCRGRLRAAEWRRNEVPLVLTRLQQSLAED